MLTRTTYLAIRALLHVVAAPARQPVQVREMAASLGASRTYMAKILGHLAKAGLLKTVRGPRGGVLLGRPPQAITLLMIVRATQGYVFAPVAETAGRVDYRTAVLGVALENIRIAGIASLERWTLADLAAGPDPETDKGEYHETSN